MFSYTICLRLNETDFSADAHDSQGVQVREITFITHINFKDAEEVNDVNSLEWCRMKKRREY